MYVFRAGAELRNAAGRRPRPLPTLLLALAVSGFARRLEASITASLESSQPSPAPVGTMITWTAQASNAGPDKLWYRFRVRTLDGTFRLIRDYGLLNTLAWTSIEEGVYELEVSIRDLANQDVAAASSLFELDSRVQQGEDVVSPTTHPLVFLYSAAACKEGRARVRFQLAGGAAQFTPYKPCVAGRSLNFYLADLAPSTTYSANLDIEEERSSTTGPPISFQTGAVPVDLPTFSAVQAPPASAPQPILLQAPLYLPGIATDLRGNLLWYGPSDLTYLTRPGPDGTFFGLLLSGIDPEHDVMRRFDLVGTTVQETNAARVNEQLASLGKRSLSGFHHEARTVSDGKIVVLGDVEQVLTDLQGPGPIVVIGDMILILDSDLQVVWTWDTFDHLDVSRRAVLGETCVASPGCAPHYLSVDANDWTHGNAVAETPDGNLLYSSCHQDWLIKIDYRFGEGSGDIIWRLGKDGDFTYDSTDPYPWFSHQHDAGYESVSSSTIALFDNGNTRMSSNPGESSRGQALAVDETSRTVRAIFSVDLGVASTALGSAQRLDDGTYHFNAGLVPDPGAAFGAEGLSVQIDPAGNRVVYSITGPTPVYRSFRVDDLYGLTTIPDIPPARTLDFR
jgi:arylsulfate sulfotransferase